MFSHEMTILVIYYTFISVGVIVSHYMTEKKLLLIEQKLSKMLALEQSSLAQSADKADLVNTTELKVPTKNKRWFRINPSSDLSIKDEEAFCPVDTEDKPSWLLEVEKWDK